MAQPYPALASGSEQVLVSFRFQVLTDGDTAPDVIVAGAGVVDDITAASNVFTITLNQNYRYTTLISCLGGIDDLDKAVQFTSYTASTGALVVTVVDWAGAAAAPADNAWVHIQAVMARRSTGAPSAAI